MSQLTSVSEPSASTVFLKDTVVNGRPAKIRCVAVDGRTYSITRGPYTLVALEDEWYDDVPDPENVIETLKNTADVNADLFTFRQKLPDTQPKYSYHCEWESIAVLPVQTYDHWWNKQIKGTTRNMIRKSQRAGVRLENCSYDDEFVRGMSEIFNETPVRQGRRFWHYGKDFETLKQQFSRFLFRETLIGAYYDQELVGFAMLGDARTFMAVRQIISKVQHREKAITNALIARSVELCATRELPSLVYGYWGDDSLADFKRHSGFQEARLPRYFVPLTMAGHLVLKTGLHHGWKQLLPDPLRRSLKALRSSWQKYRGPSCR
jgi:hypothetical protein